MKNGHGYGRMSGGGGRALNSPSKGRERPLSGADQLDGTPPSKDRQAKTNKPHSYNMDSDDYAGNVQGPLSRPVHVPTGGMSYGGKGMSYGKGKMKYGKGNPGSHGKMSY